MEYNIEQKLETAVRTLREYSVSKYVFPLNTSYTKTYDRTTFLKEKELPFLPFESPYLIYKENEYILFKSEFEVEERSGEQCYLCIETFINGVASTIRPQGLLYLNGKLRQGIDINHFEVPLEKGKYSLLLDLFTHQFPFSFPLYFSLKYKHKNTLACYYDFLVILEDLKILKKDNPLYIGQLETINKALNLIDFRIKGSVEFYDSIIKARDFLKSNYFNKICGKQENEIACIGHSHIDVAWLWDLEQTRQKSQRTFSSMLSLMDQYPDFSYFHTTPQLFEYLKEDNIELFDKIKEKVKQGRFELDGCMWVEADCNLPSGESLVRQFIYGMNYFYDEFGVKCKTLVLPDVFGYSIQIPQIMKGCGISRFVTAKIGWNDTNRFPFDSFVWEGLDGSKVFTYLISTCDASPRTGINDTTYTDYVGKLNASQLLGTWNRYQQKDLNKLTFTTVGWGDGGGGTTSEMLEKEKRFEYGLPGLGKTHLAKLNPTLDEIETTFFSNCKKKGYTPTYSNELYFEFHRGTYTSVPRIKKNNRLGEFALMNLEALYEINSVLNGENLFSKEEKAKLSSYWKILLQNQFHDILPGSSIEKVYLDSDVQFKNLFEYSSSKMDSLLAEFASKLNAKGDYLIFNPNGFVNKGIVFSDNKCYEINSVPSFGFISYHQKESKSRVDASTGRISNDFFDISLNDKGEIVSLFDKGLNKEFVKKGESINQLIAFEDIPFEYDNWEISPYYFQKKYIIDSKATFSIVDEGDRKGIKINRHYFDSTITQIIYLYNSIHRVDVVNDVVWKQKNELLKIMFPCDVCYRDIRFETQFGNISRSAYPSNSFEEAKFEVCAHKWVDMSDTDYGLAVINDCKYGYGMIDHRLSLTVCKAGRFPYEGASSCIPTFTYSLYPHKGDYIKGKVIKEAYSLNRPLLAYKLKEHGQEDVNLSFIEIKESNAFLETIKQEEKGNGLIARLYEGEGMESIIHIIPHFKFKTISLVNLLEEEIDAGIETNGNEISINLKPFQIVTLKFVL